MDLGRSLVDLAERVLPLDAARSAALPPVRAARVGAVAVARTVRHWELWLTGDDDTVGDVDVRDLTDRPGASDRRVDEPERGGAALSGSQLPVPGWAELSFADAQSALTACEADDLRTLLDYEQAHGHRTQFTLLLEHRLADRRDDVRTPD